MPPVRVRRPRRRSPDQRPGRPATPALPFRLQADGTFTPSATSPSRSARASGTCVDERRRPAGAGAESPRCDSRRRDRPEVWTHRRRARLARRADGRRARRPRRRCARCSPTTGRSCSAKSRSSASSILVADRHLPDVLLRPERRRGRPTTGRTRRCAGAEVSAAFDSVMRLSFEVRAGLLMRQIHHWAALVFVGGDRPPPLPRLLHRRLPPAARDQLDHRLHAAGAGARRRASPATRCRTICCPGPGLRIAYSVAAVDPVHRAVARVAGRSAASSRRPPSSAGST